MIQILSSNFFSFRWIPNFFQVETLYYIPVPKKKKTLYYNEIKPLCCEPSFKTIVCSPSFFKEGDLGLNYAPKLPL